LDQEKLDVAAAQQHRSCRQGGVPQRPIRPLSAEIRIRIYCDNALRCCCAAVCGPDGDGDGVLLMDHAHQPSPPGAPRKPRGNPVELARPIKVSVDIIEHGDVRPCAPGPSQTSAQTRLHARIARLERRRRDLCCFDERQFHRIMRKLHNEIKLPSYWRLRLHFDQQDRDCARLADLAQKEASAMTEDERSELAELQQRLALHSNSGPRARGRQSTPR
jgi:hypothetical protein